jgi:hypothetical protein
MPNTGRHVPARPEGCGLVVVGGATTADGNQ